MNKFINILLLLLSFPTMLLSIYVGFDMPIEFFKTTGQQMPFKIEVFMILGILYFVIIVRRTVKRWMGAKMVSAVNRFKWNVPVSKDRKKRVFVYLGLEAMLMTFMALALYKTCYETWLVATALVFGSIDSVLFLLFGQLKNIYRIGITKQALVIADREVKVLYFSGLREVTLHSDSIYFDYKDDLQLTFPSNCISKEDREDFKVQLEAQVNRDRVFFSESFKNM